jgi:dolichyl-phosphate-mannose--protein O-mannosyl transferase
MTTLTATSGLKEQVRGQLDALAKKWAAATPEQRVIAICLTIMIVGGFILRIQGLALPTWFTFDEEGFVKNAHNYGLRVPDNNDHPPLGKLLIAVGMMLFGYNSVGWRFIPLIFGLQTIVLSYWLGRLAFDRPRVGWITAAFVAADGFFISYSRSGLFDGMMLTTILWAMVMAFGATSWRGVLASGFFIGLAMSIKWIGIVTVLPAATVLLVRRRVSIFSLLAFAIVPVIHILVWMGARELTGIPSSFAETWKGMVELFHHHLGLGKFHNDLSSSWWQWPYEGHPVVIKFANSGLRGRYSSSVSNLLLFFTLTPLAVIFPVAALVTGISSKFKRYWPPLLDAWTTKNALLMMLGWFAFMFPWVLTMSTRGNYTFHHYYLPPYAFGVTMLAAFFERLERKRPTLAVVYITLVCTISIYYAPVWGEFLITSAQAKHRLFMHNWMP